MNSSDWIAAAAAIVALIALIAGEVRAYKARKRHTERRAVSWTFSWPSPNVLRVTNEGPDEARNILVRVTANFVRVQAEARALRQGESFDVPVEWASAWSSIETGYKNQGGVIAVGPFKNPFGADIYWSSPRGAPDEWHGPSAVRRAIDIAGE